MVEVNSKLVSKDKKFRKFYDGVMSDIRDLDTNDLRDQEQESKFVKDLCKPSPMSNLTIFSDKRRRDIRCCRSY